MAARDIMLHDFWLKSFSLVLAIMAWLAVHANIATTSSGSQNPLRLPEQDKFLRPIRLMTDPKDQQAYQVDPVYVTVKVNADSQVLKKLNPNDIEVSVDVTHATNFHFAFPVEVKLPRNVSLQTYYPSHVHVEPAKP